MPRPASQEASSWTQRSIGLAAATGVVVVLAVILAFSAWSRFSTRGRMLSTHEALGAGLHRNPETVRSAALDALAEDPTNGPLLTLSGLAALEIKDAAPAEAEEAFRRLASIPNWGPTAELGQAALRLRTAIATKDPEETRELAAEVAADLQPKATSGLPWVVLGGTASLLAGDLPEAARQLDEAAAQVESSTPEGPLVSLGILHTLYHNRALAHFGLNSFEVGLEAARQAVTLAPWSEPSLELLRRGLFLALRDPDIPADPAQARAILAERVVTVDTMLVDAVAMGSYDGSGENRWGLDEVSEELQLALAEAYLRMGEATRAFEAFSLIRSTYLKDRSNVRAHLVFGAICAAALEELASTPRRRERGLDGARSLVKAAERLGDDDRFLALNNAGILYLRIGRYSDAIETFQQALAACRESASFILREGRILAYLAITCDQKYQDNPRDKELLKQCQQYYQEAIAFFESHLDELPDGQATSQLLRRRLLSLQ